MHFARVLEWEIVVRDGFVRGEHFQVLEMYQGTQMREGEGGSIAAIITDIMTAIQEGSKGFSFAFPDV